jgi:hypothetical protein
MINRFFVLIAQAMNQEIMAESLNRINNFYTFDFDFEDEEEEDKEEEE